MEAEEQAQAIAALREELPTDTNDYLKDPDCLRFIIARKYDIPQAVIMVQNWWTWYNSPFGSEEGLTPRNMVNEENIDDPHREVIDALVPHSFSGFSKNGCPIFWEKTGIIAGNLPKLKEQFTMDQLMEKHIRIQIITDARRDFISKKLGRSVEQAMIICDYAELSFSPDMFGIEYCRKLFGIDEQYYPERLYKVYLINAPWYFTAIYALVSPWIDEKTATKINVLGSNYLETLQAEINDSEIPVEYGGTCENFRWAWPYDESSGASPDQIRDYIQRKNDANNR